MNNFRGDLSGISAKKEALYSSPGCSLGILSMALFLEVTTSAQVYQIVHSDLKAHNILIAANPLSRAHATET